MTNKPLNEMNDEELDRYAMSDCISRLQDKVQKLELEIENLTDTMNNQDSLFAQALIKLRNRIEELEKIKGRHK